MHPHFLHRLPLVYVRKCQLLRTSQLQCAHASDLHDGFC